MVSPRTVRPTSLFSPLPTAASCTEAALGLLGRRGHPLHCTTFYQRFVRHCKWDRRARLPAVHLLSSGFTLGDCSVHKTRCSERAWSVRHLSDWVVFPVWTVALHSRLCPQLNMTVLDSGH